MSAATGALAPGTRLAGRYQVQGRAGEHPAYARWRASEGGAEVELWSVRRDLFAAPDAAVKFVDDVLASKSLEDDHVRKPRDAALVDNALIVVMTPEGLVPEMLSASQPATDLALLRLANALASGLGAAHALGFVHGRLIPADLVEDGRVIKVGGVGMWPRVEAAVALDQWQPYRRFLAPEVIAGDEPSARADVLASAAIVAAAALGSAVAETATDVRGLHDAVAARRPDVAIALAEAFDSIPEARPYAVALLVERLEECFTGDANRTGARPRQAGADADAIKEPPPIPGPPPVPGDASGPQVKALPVPGGRKLAGVGSRGAVFDEPETVRVPMFEPPPAAHRDDPADPLTAPPPTPPPTPTPTPPAAQPPVEAAAPARAVPEPSPVSALANSAPAASPRPPLRAPSIDEEADVETNAFVRALDPSQAPSAGEVEVPSTPPPSPEPAGPPEIEPFPMATSSPASERDTGALPAARPRRGPGRGSSKRNQLVAAVAGAAVLAIGGWFALGAGGGGGATGESAVAPATGGDESEPGAADKPTNNGSTPSPAPAPAKAAAPGGAASGDDKPRAEPIAVAERPAAGADDVTPNAAQPAPEVDDGARTVEPVGEVAPAVAPAVAGNGPCPAGMVELAKNVCIDEYEAPGGGRVPTTGVTLAQARQACEGRGVRLCTSSEWEKACRGNGGASYPYGPAFRPAPCNVSGDIAAAGSFPDCASRAGAFDMAGNAAEWASDGRVRGGSALDDYRGRCSKSDARDPEKAYDDVGYRCCADAD